MTIVIKITLSKSDNFALMKPFEFSEVIEQFIP